MTTKYCYMFDGDDLSTGLFDTKEAAIEAARETLEQGAHVDLYVGEAVPLGDQLPRFAPEWEQLTELLEEAMSEEYAIEPDQRPVFNTGQSGEKLYSRFLSDLGKLIADHWTMSDDYEVIDIEIPWEDDDQ